MINLLPRKKFELLLPTGTIAGQFGTWCLKRFCDRSKCTLEEMSARLEKPQIDDICNLLLSAVEQSAREGGHPFSYTDVHACMWIDEMGGMNSEHLVALFTHSGSEQPKEGDTGEKKSNLIGENFKELVA